MFHVEHGPCCRGTQFGRLRAPILSVVQPDLVGLVPTGVASGDPIRRLPWMVRRLADSRVALASINTIVVIARPARA